MSASNCDPMIPTFTFPFLVIALSAAPARSAYAYRCTTMPGWPPRQAGALACRAAGATTSANSAAHFCHVEDLRGLLCGLVAAYKLRQHSVSLVFQLVVNPDLRRIVATYRQALEFVEELDFRQVSQVVMVGKDRQNRDSFVGAGVDKGFSGAVLTHQIDQAESLAPQRLLILAHTGCHD